MIRECIAGQTYTVRIGVRDSITPDVAKINPAINANDFRISVNDAAWEALDNAPIVTPAGSEVIRVIFSAAETTAAGVGGSIVLRVADASESDGWLGGLWAITVRAAALSELTAAQVNTEADTALSDVGMTTTVTGRIDAAVSSRSALSTTDIDNRLAAYDAPTKAELDGAIDALPTAAEVWSHASRTLTATTNNVMIVSVVNANTVTVFAKDTWSFTITSSALALSSYEAIAFVAKATAGQSDSDALLYVRSDTGLARIGGASATAGDGALTIVDGTSFLVKIAIGATGVTPGTYRWWAKGFDTTPVADEGYTLVTGIFMVQPAGVQAIS